MNSVCSPGFLLIALCGLVCSPCTEAAASETVPYRSFAVQVDGELNEWRAPVGEWHFAETQGAPGQRNQIRVRMVWDLDALLLALDVQDQELIAAPPELALDQFHQYDSLQIYVDARGDGGRRMNDDDVDILLLPDGRQGTLRGDSLIGALAPVSVPQRVAAPLPVDYATRVTASGWQAELRVPFAGLGLSAQSGLQLGLDVASNDWLVDHPPGDSEALTPDRVRLLADRPARAPTADPAVGTQLLPRNWMGADDFGYPDRWRRLELVGEPGPWERVVRRLGHGMAVFLVSLAGLLSGLSCAVAVYFWQRRQLRRALAQLQSLRIASVPGDPEPVTQEANDCAEPPEQTEFAPDAVASETGPAPRVSPRERAFAEQVLAYVQQNLSAPLGPAELAGRFHVSIRTLQRRLKTGLDASPQDLVLAARMNAAQALLRDGRLRVGEVADRVGFQDLSYFTRCYRQAFGRVPSAELQRPANPQRPH